MRLREFAPDSNDDSGEEDILHKYARMWWAGDEATQLKIEAALDRMGWEIGEDEGGYDNGGVFVVRAGDVNGDSYVSWAAEDLTEATGDQKFDSMMSQMTAEPKYPDQDMPPTSVPELIQWADKNNKPYHEYFAQWARKNGFKNVNDALVWFGDNVDPSNPWGPKDFEDPFGRPAAEELEDAAKHDPKAAELMKVFRCYEEIVFDWPDEYRQMNMPEGAPISGDGGAVDNFRQQMANNTEVAYQKGMAEAKKKKKSSRSLGRYFFPGYGYYGSSDSGEGGGDGGGESKNYKSLPKKN